MTFSIKTTIRAWWVPEHRINCPRRLWNLLVGELERRGNHRHEAGAFLLGYDRKGRREVTDIIYYDDLDSKAYATGVCVLHGDAFAKLWEHCRETGLTVVADVHTHPGSATQSPSDRTNPMVARRGHVAVIVPHYAMAPVTTDRLGIYEYRGEHQWLDRSVHACGQFLYTGFWS